MGQYKVPQDVEAEDKLIGFLTLKQFIYCIIGLMWGFVSYKLLIKLPFIFVIVGIPPAAIFLMLGLVRRQGQPFETYFVAMVNFYFKPRVRLWHKDPIIEVFKLEPPKITQEHTQRSPEEVRSKLDQVAQIVDTRGWVSKEPDIQEPEPSKMLNMDDRIAIPDAPAATAADAQPAPDDMLDFGHNPQFANINVLIEDAVKNVRDEAMAKMMEQAAGGSKQVAAKTSSTATSSASTSEMTTNPVAGILKLAMENDDLTVSQIAAQAQKHVALSEGQVVEVRGTANTPQPQH